MNIMTVAWLIFPDTIMILEQNRVKNLFGVVSIQENEKTY